MKDQFAGHHGRQTLIDTLKRQKVVAGNTELAEQIASLGELVDVTTGTAVIQQGGDDNEVYLILAGSFHIVVNGKVLARRTANDHVGEMAAILPVQRRAASVIAHEESVVVRLADSQVADLGNRYPQIWRCFALELAHRVEQRNKASAMQNENVRVFIMASTGSNGIARGIQTAFVDEPLEVIVWSEGVFRGATYAIDSLESELDRSDIAIAVADSRSTRDDIIFELGFFMGRLGRHRTFLLEPNGDAMDLPLELAGINTITYISPDEMGAVIDRLRKSISELGPNR